MATQNTDPAVYSTNKEVKSKSVSSKDNHSVSKR